MSELGNDAGESTNDVAPEDSSSARGDDRKATRESRRAREGTASYNHTRTSAAWAGVIVAVLFGVALTDFIAQNTSDVRIEFFSAGGRLPIAVALLAAALAGAVVVLAIGVARVAQLRLNLRRQRQRLRAQGDGALGRDARPDDESSSAH